MTPQDIRTKRAQKARRAKRVRAKIFGTAERPRLSVTRSLKHISAQLINDKEGKTLAASSDMKMGEGKKGMELATAVGMELAKKAKTAGITKAVFDRGSYLYHGRVKALADAAREGGLEF